MYRARLEPHPIQPIRWRRWAFAVHATRRRGGCDKLTSVSLLETVQQWGMCCSMRVPRKPCAPGTLFIDMASIQPREAAKTTPHGLVKWAWRTWMLQCLAAFGRAENGTSPSWPGAGQKTLARAQPVFAALGALPPTWGRTAAGSSTKTGQLRRLQVTRIGA